MITKVSKRKVQSLEQFFASMKKVELVLAGLFLFGVIFVASVVLRYVSSSEFYVNIFRIISWVAGLTSLVLLFIYFLLSFVNLFSVYLRHRKL